MDHITDPKMPEDLRVLAARVSGGEDPDEVKGIERLWLYRVERDADEIFESQNEFFVELRRRCRINT